jgi:GNAT superfamily N-acetyltransferase
MAKNNDDGLGPADLKAFEAIRHERVTRGMAPLYGDSIRRLITAGLVHLGADGVYHEAGTTTAPPGPLAAPPRREPKVQALVARVTPTEHAAVREEARRRGIGITELLREALDVPALVKRRDSTPPVK